MHGQASFSGSTSLISDITPVLFEIFHPNTFLSGTNICEHLFCPLYFVRCIFYRTSFCLVFFPHPTYVPALSSATSWYCTNYFCQNRHQQSNSMNCEVEQACCVTTVALPGNRMAA